MSPSEINIVSAIEDYRTDNELTMRKMAKMCGMSSVSIYSNWTGKLRKGKLEYFLNFLESSGEPVTNYISLPRNANKTRNGHGPEGELSECRKRIKSLEEQLKISEQWRAVREEQLKMLEEKLKLEKLSKDNSGISE